MNQKQFDYVGITQYHQNGFYGKGVKILYTDIERNEKGSHADKAMQIIKQVAPLAEVLYFHNEYGQEKQAVDMGITEGVQIYSTSTSFNYSGDTIQPLMEATKKAVDAGIILLCSAGNNGENSMGSTAKNTDWFAVGAADFGWNGSIERQDYSSYDKAGDLAFMALTNMETTAGMFGGTSCANPFAAGMIALWMEQYQKEYGKLPNKIDLLHMIRDNTEDMEDKGRDIKTGVGLLKLPLITNYKTDPNNPLSVQMIKLNGEVTYVHKDFVEVYIKEESYKLAD